MKNVIKLTLIALLVVSASSFSYAKTSPPENNTVKEVLGNGVTVIASEKADPPIVTIQVTLWGGISSEGDYLGSGISHFIEHMAFQGTAKRPAGQVEKEVKSYGGSINASTGLDSVNIYITVPSKYFQNAIKLVEDITFNPSYPDKEVKKEKEIILKEMLMLKDDPARVVMRALWDSAFLEHPYKYPVIGYEELFKGISRDDLVHFHGERYVPQNIIVAITGNVDAEEAIQAARASFGAHERRKAFMLPVSQETTQVARREIKSYLDVNLGYIAMGFHTVPFSHEDVFAIDVLGTILGSGNGSRFNEKIVKEKELLYTISSFNYTPKFPGLFIIYGIGSPLKIKNAETEILKIIENIKQNGVSPEELLKAKNLAKSAYIDSLETTSDLAASMAQGEFFTGNPEFFLSYLGSLDKVNNESIRKAAKKYLGEENLTVSYLFPREFERALPEKKDKKSGKPALFKTLKNGIRVIIKEDSRLPKISLVAAFLGGLRAESRTSNGLSSLTSSMLLKGTGKRSEKDIMPYVESLGGSMGSFSGFNTFGVSAECLKGDFESVLGIVADILQNSVFPEEEIRKEKEKIYAAIKAQDDDMYDTAFLKARRGLFEKYPYGMRSLGEPDSVESLTRNELEEFYRRYCVAGNFVLSIAGDCDAQAVFEKIDALFGSVKNGNAEMPKTSIEPLKGIRDIFSTMNREQSIVVVGTRGTMFTKPDRYALSLACSVLSGENGRLYRIARNKLGLSYAQGAFSIPGVLTGYVLAYIATDKKNLERAQKSIITEFQNLHSGKIQDEEIALSKNALLGRHLLSIESLRSLAYRMALDEIYGLGYDDYLRYEKKIVSVTKADVISAAREYLNPDNCVVCAIRGQDE